jgi:hypothetical protein
VIFPALYPRALTVAIAGDQRLKPKPPRWKVSDNGNWQIKLP